MCIMKGRASIKASGGIKEEMRIFPGYVELTGGEYALFPRSLKEIAD